MSGHRGVPVLSLVEEEPKSAVEKSTHTRVEMELSVETQLITATVTTMNVLVSTEVVLFIVISRSPALETQMYVCHQFIISM